MDIEGILDAAKVVAPGRRFREAEAGHMDVPLDLASIVAHPGANREAGWRLAGASDDLFEYQSIP